MRIEELYDGPIRVCIGTEPKMYIPTQVLKHSILTRTQREVEFIHMHGGTWEKNPGGSTGFSFKRWMIPEYVNYKGWAIYLDSDIVLLDDIEELWLKPEQFPKEDNVIWCTKKRAPLFSVMVINCAEADNHWEFEPGLLWKALAGKRLAKRDVMHGLWFDPPPIYFEQEWNHIDLYDHTTKLLHYSDLKRQPWFDPSHKHKDVWEKELRSAFLSGYIQQGEIKEALDMYGKRKGLHPSYVEILKA